AGPSPGRLRGLHVGELRAGAVRTRQNRTDSERYARDARALRIHHHVDTAPLDSGPATGTQLGPCMASIESIVVLMPVLDDWQAMSLLIPRLAAALRPVGVRARLLIVDDGSTESAAEGLARAERDGFDWVRVLR